MKKLSLFAQNAIVFLMIVVTSCKTMTGISDSAVKKDYSKYVNPFIGTAPLTDSAIIGYKLPDKWRAWAGLVFPGSSLPNAMVQLSPVTEWNTGAGYEYEDTVIQAFTHTNKGHWNLCNIPVLPISAKKDTGNKYFSRYLKNKETAGAGFYKVFLEDYKIAVSLTSTLRCGFHKYDYTDKNNRQILFDLAKANNRVLGWGIEQVGNDAVQGYQEVQDEKVYFYATFNEQIERLDKRLENTKNGNAIILIRNGGTRPVELKIGLSYVSTENAKQNLDAEIGTKSFDDIHNLAIETWEKLLSKIAVKGGTEKQRELFYSSLYRSCLWPALRSDINGEYTDVKKKVVKADFNYYTVPSLWDTYRNKEVLLGIVSPKITTDVIRSLIDMGDKTGFIPTFFHGDHAAPFIAGAYLRGIEGFDVQRAYELLLRNANVEGPSRPFLNEYLQKGFISEKDIAKPHTETIGSAGVSKTMEYSYDDYSVAQIAKKLGDTANYRILMKRSGNYKNMFDPATQFMRGKLANGEFIKNFNPEYPYYEYMYREANAWQASFFAPHDMKGLIALYGGNDRFESRLDSLFTKPWKQGPSYIARNVESMIGQYCHGNQPDHEAPFAYHFIGKPEKSQKIIDNILGNLYGIGKDGLALCGMDDAGEMSSWYVLSALGLYTFSAADPEYIVTVPVFDEIKWKLENDKILTIKKEGKSRNMNAITVNGKKISGYFIPHELLKNGGKINISTK